MALSSKHADIRCKGWDPDGEKSKAAEALKVFQPVCKDLKGAVKDAALVLVSLPPQEFQAALAEWKTAGLPAAVLVNLSALQAAPAAWIESILGTDAPYFSMLLSLNPAYLNELPEEQNQTHADLFNGGRIYISASPRAEEGLLNIAVDLAVLLGGQPVFAEASEVDGWAAANRLLPELAACALMNAVSTQPSWREGRHLAGSALAAASAPLAELPAQDWAQTVLADNQNAVRVLDSLVPALRDLRQALLDQDASALEELLSESQSARAEWLEKRMQSAPAGQSSLTSVPSKKNALENFLKLGQ
jgi:prephenate dehydrogenase